MTVLAVTTAKGSPGATTLAVALAAVAAERRPATVVEADTSGGDLAARAGLRLEPGLETLAGAARHRGAPGLLDAHLQPLPNGARALVAPTHPAHVTSALGALGPRLGGLLEAVDGLTVVDLGRWGVAHPARDVARIATGIVLVIPPTVSGVDHARARLDTFPEQARVVVATLGDRPYGPAEIAAVLDVRAVAIAVDPRSADVLGGGNPLDRWSRRAPLVRSTRLLLEILTDPRPVLYPEAVR